MFAKTTEKSAWKIISDPVAEERQWLAAAEVVKESPLPSHVARTPATHKLSDTAHSWLASFGGLFAGVGMFFVTFTLFTSVGSAFGIEDTLTTYSDWLRAVFWMAGMPTIGCAIAGYLQRPNAAYRPWVWSIPVVPWMTIGGAAFGRDIGLPATLGLIWFGMAMSVLSFVSGRELAKWWQQHLPPMKLAAPVMPIVIALALMVWGIIANVYMNNPPSSRHSQMTISEGWFGVQLLTVVSFFLSAFVSCYCGSRQLSTCLMAAFTMQVPLLMFYLSALIPSVLFTSLSLAGGSLDAGALIVSLACIAFTFACTAGGGTLGWFARTRAQ